MEREERASGHMAELNWSNLDFSKGKVVQSAPLNNKMSEDRSLRHQLFGLGWIEDQKLNIFGRNSNNKMHTSERLYTFDLQARKWVTNKYYGSLGEIKDTSQTWDGVNLLLLGKDDLNRKMGQRTYGRVAFNTEDYKFSHWGNKNDAPEPRSQCLFEAIEDDVIVYGGFNAEKVILKDAFIFSEDKWSKLKVVGSPPPSLLWSSVVCGDKIILFGGRCKVNSRTQYYNDLYEASVDQLERVLKFERVPVNSRLSPIGRRQSAMTCISDSLIIIAGGENAEYCREHGRNLDDAWLFDLSNNEWHQIILSDPELLPKRQFFMDFYQNELLIYGGHDFSDGSPDCITFIQFGPKSKNKKAPQTSEVIKSLRQITQKREEQDTKVPEHKKEGSGLKSRTQVSNGLLYSASMNIRSAFQAIQKIVEFSELLDAKQHNIHALVTDNLADEYFFINFRFDGNFLPPSLFMGHSTSEFIDHSEARLLKEVNNLMIYCLRLGKCMLFVQNKKGARNVRLVSSDPKITPCLEKQFVTFQYTENFETGKILPSQNGLRNKRVIYDALQTMLKDPREFLESIESSLVSVFELNIILTLEKIYYYELIFLKMHVPDISLYKNEAKGVFLQSCSYDIEKSMEYSLNRYLQFRHSSELKSEMKVYLNLSEEPLNTNYSYSDHLSQLAKDGSVVPLGIKPIQNVDRGDLYCCLPQKALAANDGILLYSQGRLVNRFECQFGEVMARKFYKRRYKAKGHNIFPVVGAVHVSSKVKLLNFGTQFAPTKLFKRLCIELTDAVEEAMEATLNKAENSAEIAKAISWEKHLNESVEEASTLGTKRIKKDDLTSE